MREDRGGKGAKENEKRRTEECERGIWKIDQEDREREKINLTEEQFQENENRRK